MNILVTAATPFEMQDLNNHINEEQQYYAEKELYINTLVTGVGMVATTYHLTRYLQHNDVDMMVQVGVAGSFRQGISLGSVVKVASDAFGDLGAEDHNAYLDVFDMQLYDEQEYPFDNKLLFMPEVLPVWLGKGLKEVHAITVNMCSGKTETIAYRKRRFAADIESMEGAAFHYVGLQEKVPFIQIRSISNYVEPRDKSSWQMKKAIKNLNEYMIESFQNL